MKSVLEEFMFGSTHYKEALAEEEGVQKLFSWDKFHGYNSSFELGKDIFLHTCNRGYTFYVTEQGNMVDNHKKIESAEELALLILDYSNERLEEFAEDKYYSVKLFLNHLSSEEKDLMLYNILTNQEPKEEMN